MYKLHYDNFLINEHDDDDDAGDRGHPATQPERSGERPIKPYTAVQVKKRNVSVAYLSIIKFTSVHVELNVTSSSIQFNRECLLTVR